MFYSRVCSNLEAGSQKVFDVPGRLQGKGDSAVILLFLQLRHRARNLRTTDIQSDPFEGDGTVVGKAGSMMFVSIKGLALRTARGDLSPLDVFCSILEPG